MCFSFFRYCNPLLGILDPNLHTPNYVYSRSFTLFSVVCALGCAVSGRTRDRYLYPVLLDLAEADIKWSIAYSVKSLETIQAIMNKQYWAPAPRCQSEDPSWLRLSHVSLIPWKCSDQFSNSIILTIGNSNCPRNGYT